MLEMPFTVVFIVSSSVQSIPKAIRAKGQTRPITALMAIAIHIHTNTHFITRTIVKREA